eukprot:gene10203-5086_t
MFDGGKAAGKGRGQPYPVIAHVQVMQHQKGKGKSFANPHRQQPTTYAKTPAPMPTKDDNDDVMTSRFKAHQAFLDSMSK